MDPTRFHKLRRDELTALGYAERSERYIDATTGAIISKRQYQKLQRGGLTYRQFKRAVTSGERSSARAKPIALKGGKVRLQPRTITSYGTALALIRERERKGMLRSKAIRESLRNVGLSRSTFRKISRHFSDELVQLNAVTDVEGLVHQSVLVDPATASVVEMVNQLQRRREDEKLKQFEGFVVYDQQAFERFVLNTDAVLAAVGFKIRYSSGDVAAL